MAPARRGGPRLFAPEVVQTSAMDCGPAALKCLLDGFGLHASYGRLREACQTDVDGTSIDTIEDLANDMGLVAEQILLPLDHVATTANAIFPAIVVVRQPGGGLHFLVAWRSHGPVVQLMDPATGRRWPRWRVFTDDIYLHTIPVEAVAWRQWAGSDLFRDGLQARADRCRIPRPVIDSLIRDAARDEGWRPLAALDASLRMVSALGRSGAFNARDAERTLRAVWERACTAADPQALIPADYWTVTPAPAADAGEHVLVRGAVLVSVRGVRPAAERQAHEAELSREIVAALREKPASPARDLLSVLRGDGILAPLALLTALLLAAAGVVFEALLFRSLIDIGSHLALSGQRFATIGALVCLSALLLALEVPIARGTLRLGRVVETRLRVAFLRKIPRLADRYLHSRPTSDMAERAHTAHQIRELPNMGAQLARSTFELILTTAAISLLYPESGPLALVAAVAALAIPLAAQPWLAERDLRQRTHGGALTRFYLDALLGLVPVRAHGAERSLAREQEALLVEWAKAGRAFLGTAVTTSGVQLASGFALAAALVFSRARMGDEGAGALLLAYWALNIPLLGQEIAQIAWQYPMQRNLTLRLLEPLGALEEGQTEGAPPPGEPARSDVAGVRIELRDVTVRAGGHTIIEDVSLAIAPGAHVAIVGASGAGKSTLVGVLLGWHVPASGTVFVDREPLTSSALDRLRRHTAWVDPAVQLWNRSLIENLEFGCGAEDGLPLGPRIAEADLPRLIEQLPEGLQTPLGEGGALVSGGEGQRVRFGRGLGRSRARLVMLDEPFRGLERDGRALLLRRARQRWHAATLLCVTHDISETTTFDRVLVVAHGRVVEDGTPSELMAAPDSGYRTMLTADSELHRHFEGDPAWQILRLVDGQIVGGASSSVTATPRGEDDHPHRERVTV